MTTPGQIAPREPVSFLVFSGSLRAGSLNKRLAALAAASIRAKGGMVDHASLREFDVPGYDGDVEDASGMPERARELCRQRRAACALRADVEAFIELVEAAKHYPCVESRWIEFLGERPDPAVDRVE